MLNISSRGFKLSIISLAILSAQYTFAQDTQNLATITVQVMIKLKKVKLYIVKFIECKRKAKLNLTVKETPQTVNVVTRQQMDDFCTK